LDADFAQPITDLIKLERLDDGFDLFITPSLPLTTQRRLPNSHPLNLM
jgi:hypothetical protein